MFDELEKFVKKEFPMLTVTRTDKKIEIEDKREGGETLIELQQYDEGVRSLSDGCLLGVNESCVINNLQELGYFDLV